MRGKSPEEFMAELGFGPLDLVESFSVSMAGEDATQQKSCNVVYRVAGHYLLQRSICHNAASAHLALLSSARMSWT